MRNRFALLGLLGLLGFFGFTKDNTLFFSFFCFLSFFSYWRVPCDELFLQNIRNSASISYAIFLIGNIFIILFSVVKKVELLYISYPIIFTITLVMFVVSLFFYEKIERRDCE